MAELVCPGVAVYVCVNSIPAGKHLPRQWMQEGVHVQVRHCRGRVLSAVVELLLEHVGKLSIHIMDRVLAVLMVARVAGILPHIHFVYLLLWCVAGVGIICGIKLNQFFD